jgi:hypothetical protein
MKMVTKFTMKKISLTDSIKLILVSVCAVAAFAVASVAQAASLSLSPSTGVYTAGDTFTTRVMINTAGGAINAAEATISFNPAQLSVVNVQKGNTFTLWAVEPAFSNSAGTITFGGGSPAGYTGSNGLVLNITWRSRGSGPARISFSNGSILAADGRGTNVVQSLNGGSYTIMTAAVQPEPETIEYIAPPNTPARPELSATTHPADGWSQETTATLAWTVPAGVTAVRTLLDNNSGSIPTRVYEPPIDTITLEELAGGIQYFHLQFRNADGWGRVLHHRLAVDTAAPEDFVITRSDRFDLTSPTQELVLEVTDARSPVTRFMVQHNGGESYEYQLEDGASSTLELTDLTPGQQSFVIEAFDAAGNSRVATLSFVIEAFGPPVWTDVPARLQSNVVPALLGTTKANATVQATLTPVNRGEQGSVPQVYEVVADEQGMFRVIPDGLLAEGVYELVAVATDTTGAQSQPSETVRLIVTPPGYVTIGQTALSVLSVLVPLVALVVLLVLVLVYGLARLRRIRTVVTRETTDALSVLGAQFTALRDIVRADSEALRNSRKTKKLTKSETQLVEDVMARIDSAETAIHREIAEVDDIVTK